MCVLGWAKGCPTGRFVVATQRFPGDQPVPNYPVPSTSASFEPAVEAFRRLLAHLATPTTAAADHATVERVIDTEGTELMRLLFQGWLDQRASAEPRRNVAGQDGVLRTHHRSSAREIECLFGTAVVRRDRVGSPGVRALAPLDATLNLPDDRFTLGVRERVATEAARGSFEAAVDVMDETTGAAVAKRQAEELVRSAAVDFDAFYEEKVRSDVAGTSPCDLLVLTVDGKGVVMRPDGLREGTRKKATRGTHKLAGRLSKGEKRNRKRMATVAAVYDLPPVPRSVSDVLGELARKPSVPRPRARRKRVWASLEKMPRDVIVAAFAEAEQRDPAHKRRWVALVDGNATQIREIRRAARCAGVEVTPVLDFIHVTEYLWDAAWEFYKEGDPRAESWVRKYQGEVLRGRASLVAAAIRRAATARRLERRTSTDAAATYLLGHRDMLRYDLYLRDGLPIGTGVIEGTCRHLVKDRMDITGARWGLAGAEAILRLRSLAASGDLAAYWEFHREREFERNHASHYADAEETWLWRAAA